MSLRRQRRFQLCRLEDRRTPAQFVVSSLAASGAGSFRQAVLDAQASPGADEVVFAPGLNGTIVLGAALPAITQELTITGPGPAAITIDANFKGRHFDFNDADDAEAPMAVSGLRLINGLSSGGGGAIRNNDCALTLTNVVIENCSTTGRGGAVFQLYGSLLVDGAVISGNVAKTGDGGGLAAVVAAPVTVLNSTISGNRATPSTSSGGEGGGISVYYATLTVRDSVISGNAAEGGYSSAYGGGGILVGYFATATLTNTTVSGNTSARGAAGVQVAYSTAATIENCTISGNTALNGNGGGLSLRFPYGNVVVRQTTIAFNSANGKGGGVSVQTYLGTAEFTGVIISGNTASVSGADVTGDITADFSLITDATGSTVTGANNQLGVSARLGMLTNYGGKVATHLPASPSPARDSGPASSALLTDQRGAGFPRLVGGSVDIGAVESIAGAPVAFPESFPGVTDPATTPYTFAVTFADDTGFDLGKLSTGDVVVVGPGGTLIPTLTGTVVNGPAGEVVATFSLAAPGGSWDPAENGPYAVTVLANQVFDTGGAAVAAGVVGAIQVAVPAPLVVNATNDEAVDTDGLLSLREALLIANATPAVEQITFDPILNGQSITLTGELAVTAAVKITGPGANQLTVNANFKGRHFNIDLLAPGGAVAIAGLTLTNGLQTGDAGSIRNEDAVLTLTGIVAVGNTASGSGGVLRLGGFDTTSATITDSVFEGNQAGSDGGAIFVPAGGPDLTVTNSRFIGNLGTGLNSDGGAIAVSGSANSVITIETSTFTGNAVIGGGAGSGNGGAIHVTGGSVSISRSTINGNSAAAGAGGAVNARNIQNLAITNSTLSTNLALRGGGIATDVNAVVVVRNATIAFNTATGGGGGLDVPSGLVQLASTIVAGNSGTTAPDAAGTVEASASLVGDATGSSVTGTFITGNPFLGPLQDNGGPTFTHAISNSSPAWNAGDNPAGLAVDQRGQPRTAGAGTDIGAYELAAAAAPPTATIKVGDGSTQRSVLTSFTVTFSEAVSFPGGLPAAITLQRTGPGGPTGAVSLAFAVAGNQVTVTFDDPVFAPGSAKSLIDGRYTLTLVAGQIQGVGGKLDGNGDGTAGDNQTLLTHRLFGDVNGNATVDTSDFLAFRLAFLSASPAFDFDGNGTVDAGDFLQFRLRFLQSV